MNQPVKTYLCQKCSEPMAATWMFPGKEYVCPICRVGVGAFPDNEAVTISEDQHEGLLRQCRILKKSLQMQKGKR